MGYRRRVETIVNQHVMSCDVQVSNKYPTKQDELSS